MEPTCARLSEDPFDRELRKMREIIKTEGHSRDHREQLLTEGNFCDRDCCREQGYVETLSDFVFVRMERKEFAGGQGSDGSTPQVARELQHRTKKKKKKQVYTGMDTPLSMNDPASSND